MKALTRTPVGFNTGRQSHSPLPLKIDKPSESWISGRQSFAMRRSFSPHWNMLVSGATPRRSTDLRG